MEHLHCDCRVCGSFDNVYHKMYPASCLTVTATKTKKLPSIATAMVHSKRSRTKKNGAHKTAPPAAAIKTYLFIVCTLESNLSQSEF